MFFNGNFVHDEDKSVFIFWGEDRNKPLRIRRYKNNKYAVVDPGEKDDILKACESVDKSVNSPSTEEVYKYKFTLRYDDILIVTDKVKGITFSVWDTFKLLIRINPDENYDFNLSDTLKFWSQCARFTAELIYKHKYLPYMEWQGGRLLSRWKTELRHPEDIARFTALSRGMPPLCRMMFFKISCDESGINDIEVPSSEKYLLDFLNWLTDGIIREAAIGEEGVNIFLGLSSPLETAWVKSIGDKSEQALDLPEEDKKLVFNYFEKWILPVQENNLGSFRTCFRLNPPTGDKDLTWRLEYLLQARADGNNIISASDLWVNNEDGEKQLSAGSGGNLQELLLKDLGTASRTFRPILKSLYSEKPSGCNLTIEEAYRFLEESAAVLEESGFGIIAPSRGKKPERIALNIKLKEPEEGTYGGILNLNTILDYDWKAAIGDYVLSEEDFRKLSRIKVPLVRVRGEWVQLNSGQVRAIAHMWRKKDKGFKLADILKMKLGHEELIPGLPVKKLVGDRNLGNFIKSLSDKSTLEKIQSPKKLHGTLRPYQERGFSWMWYLRKRNIGACLADDMGLGKTIQMIALLLYERQEGVVTQPALLVCPTSVAGNWLRELAKFAPDIKVLLHHGQKRSSGETFINEIKSYDLIITTYSLAYRDVSYFNKIQWSGVVLDEAQNIKNTGSKQSQAVKSLKAEYRIALTGTPVENRLSELWSIMDFLNPGYLGNNASFRKEYALPIEKYHDYVKGNKLKSLIAPFVLRRLKTDRDIIKDLPDKIETKVYCSLTKEQAALYEAVVQDLMDRIDRSDGIERKGMILSTITKLKQICNHPVNFLKKEGSLGKRSGKLERLFEILDEILSEGDKVLIFTQFTEMGELLKIAIREHLRKDSLFLHGGVPRKEREQIIDSFQNDREPSIFILSLKAGGVGLNLTRATHVIHFDRWWNPAVENQATDRAFRIGQTRNVQVHKFICSGTLEERIDTMIEEKKELAENIVGAGENWLTELSSKQLGEILRLNYDSILSEEEDEHE